MNHTIPRTSRARFAAALLAVAALVFAPSAAAQATSANELPAYDLPQLSEAENQLLNSESPTTIVVDVSTGEIESVAMSNGIVPFAVVQNNCSNGRACW